jgi:predicted DsbA family dithiol-disulfide isomerase
MPTDSVGAVGGLAEPRVIEVHAWVDVACPWCWIAKRRFEAATTEYGNTEYGNDVAIEYHSFELAPDLSIDYVSSEADF